MMMHTKIYTPTEIAAWEAQQDPATLPALDLARLAAMRRWQAEQRRIAAIAESRRGKATKKAG